MVKYGLNTDADYMHALTHSAVCMARMRKSGIFLVPRCVAHAVQTAVT